MAHILPGAAVEAVQRQREAVSYLRLALQLQRLQRLVGIRPLVHHQLIGPVGIGIAEAALPLQLLPAVCCQKDGSQQDRQR